MCDTCRPALGPLCMTHRGRGWGRGGIEIEGKAPTLYMREKGEKEWQNEGT